MLTLPRVSPGPALDPDLVSECLKIVAQHEEDWGLDDDEGVGVSGSLCAMRGRVRMHVDDEYAGHLFVGVILLAEGEHRLVVDGQEEASLLSTGDVYVLDPLIRHGTSCQDPDALLMFVVSTIQRDVEPAQFEAEVDKARVRALAQATK